MNIKTKTKWLPVKILLVCTVRKSRKCKLMQFLSQSKQNATKFGVKLVKGKLISSVRHFLQLYKKQHTTSITAHNKNNYCNFLLTFYKMVCTSKQTQVYKDERDGQIQGNRTEATTIRQVCYQSGQHQTTIFDLLFNLQFGLQFKKYVWKIIK